MRWRIMQALVAAGHVLPKPTNRLPLEQYLYHAPVSAVCWLLQQGIVFDSDTLLSAARAGRLDILQLAYSKRVPITAEMISAAALKSKWEVLVWACRNGVIFDCAHMEQLLRQKYQTFSFAEQKLELLELLRDVRKRGGAPAASREEDADRTQKRRRSKR